MELETRRQEQELARIKNESESRKAELQMQYARNYHLRTQLNFML